MIRSLITLRWYVLLLTVPVTLLWIRSQSLGVVTEPLLVITHAMVVLLWAAASTRTLLAQGLAPRLGLTRGAGLVDVELLDVAFPILAVLTPLLGVALLFANFWIGLGALLTVGLIFWQTGLPTRGRFVLIELILPVVALAGPALLFRAHSWGAPPATRVFENQKNLPAEAEGIVGAPLPAEIISPTVLAASLLAAAMVATLLLLCLIRDAGADRWAGIATTATLRGRGAASVLAWAWIVGVATMALLGAGWGWWHWSAAALTMWTGFALAGLLASRLLDYLVGAGFAGYGAAILVMAATTA